MTQQMNLKRIYFQRTLSRYIIRLVGQVPLPYFEYNKCSPIIIIFLRILIYFNQFGTCIFEQNFLATKGQCRCRALSTDFSRYALYYYIMYLEVSVSVDTIPVWCKIKDVFQRAPDAPKCQLIILASLGNERLAVYG